MKLNKRGEILFAVSLGINALLLLGLILWGLDHVNWVGDRYCFESSLECYFPESGGK
jgi:hypothetical protein